MAEFRFDPDKGFSENLQVLLETVSETDPEMVSVFQDNLPELLSGSGDSARREAITRFNEKVAKALESIEPAPREEAGE